jgi:hypothetical protein
LPERNEDAADRGEYRKTAGIFYELNCVEKITANLVTSDNHAGRN